MRETPTDVVFPMGMTSTDKEKTGIRKGGPFILYGGVLLSVFGRNFYNGEYTGDSYCRRSKDRRLITAGYGVKVAAKERACKTCNEEDCRCHADIALNIGRAVMLGNVG